MGDRYYMVFSGHRWTSIMGAPGINWNHDKAIVGIFKAKSADAALKEAAHKEGAIGTMFAIEGLAFGIDFLDRPPAKEYGVAETDTVRRIDQLERVANLLESGLSEASLRAQDRALEAGSTNYQRDGEEDERG